MRYHVEFLPSGDSSPCLAKKEGGYDAADMVWGEYFAESSTYKKQRTFDLQVPSSVV
jgi:hypothetical protein